MSAGSENTTKEKEEVFSEEDEERSVEDEDLERAMKEAASSAVSRRKPPDPQVLFNIPAYMPEAVEDFLRNFLRKAGLSRTLRSFEAEWYSSAQRLLQESLPTASTAAPGILFIPDALTHAHLLQLELDSVRRDADLLRGEVLAAADSLVRMQRERHFHRLQHGRVAAQKNQLLNDLQQLRRHLQSYEPALRQVEDRYLTALRHKTLISFQKDRLLNATDPRGSQEKATGRRCQKQPEQETC